MGFRLIPRDESFYPLFEEQADRIVGTATALRGLLDTLPVSDDGVKSIVDAERAGDELTDRIRAALEKSIVTPFDREDIQALANHLDDVLDEMRAVADHLQLHGIQRVVPGVVEQLDLLVSASERQAALVRLLPTLKGVSVVANEIERIESEADATYRRVTAELFSGKHEPLEILRWKDIVEAIESATDAIEDASDVVQFIAVKHA